MQAIDKKLLRDFRRLWLQALAIALVLACGVAILLTSIGMFTALKDTRNTYYERNRFAQVFARMTRAPESLAVEISHIDGVMSVQTRIVGGLCWLSTGAQNLPPGTFYLIPKSASRS